MKAGNLAGIVRNNARHCAAAVDGAAGDDLHLDRMVETPDTDRASADSQIGSECKHKKAARKFSGRKTGVLRWCAFERAGWRRLLVRSGERRGHRRDQKRTSHQKSRHFTFKSPAAGVPDLPAPPKRP